MFTVFAAAFSLQLHALHNARRTRQNDCMHAQILQPNARQFVVMSGDANGQQEAAVSHHLKDKVAIVTGGAKGIGYACAACMGAEGAKVVIADIDEAAAREASEQLSLEGITAYAIRCDVGVREEVYKILEQKLRVRGGGYILVASAGTVEDLVAQTLQICGGVDILVANAGIVRAADFLAMSEADFDEVLRINLKGVFLCGQAVGRQMMEQNRVKSGRGGAIINMSSVNGAAGNAATVGYNASKGAIDNLTRMLAGPAGVAATNDAALERILSRTPMLRIGDPLEVGKVAVFLASQDSSYITGETLYVDGGRRALHYTVDVSPAALAAQHQRLQRE